MAEAKAAHDKLTTDPELEAVLRERDRLIMVEEVFRATQLAEMRKLGLDEGKRLGLDEGKRLGLDEGKRQGERALARRLLAGGMAPAELASVLGLSAHQLDDLLR